MYKTYENIILLTVGSIIEQKTISKMIQKIRVHKFAVFAFSALKIS